MPSALNHAECTKSCRARCIMPSALAHQIGRKIVSETECVLIHFEINPNKNYSKKSTVLYKPVIC